jgi:hypothetical protein
MEPLGEAKPLKRHSFTAGKPTATGALTQDNMPDDPYGTDEWENAWNSSGPYARWIMAAVVTPQVVFVLASGAIGVMAMIEIMHDGYTKSVELGQWLPVIYCYTIVAGAWFIVALLLELQLKPLRRRSEKQTWPMPSIDVSLTTWSLGFSTWALVVLARLYNGDVPNVINNNNQWRFAMALLMMATGAVVKHVLARVLHCVRVKVRVQRATCCGSVKSTGGKVKKQKKKAAAAAPATDEEEDDGAGMGSLDEDSGSGSDSHDIAITDE